jgi:hypothetical protein
MNTQQKRIGLRLEFYLRGKKRIPAVSFLGVDDYGVPMTSHNDPEEWKIFDEFSKAAHKFCAAMQNMGKFD